MKRSHQPLRSCGTSGWQEFLTRSNQAENDCSRSSSITWQHKIWICWSCRSEFRKAKGILTQSVISVLDFFKCSIISCTLPYISHQNTGEFFLNPKSRVWPPHAHMQRKTQKVRVSESILSVKLYPAKHNITKLSHGVLRAKAKLSNVIKAIVWVASLLCALPKLNSLAIAFFAHAQN